MVKKRNAPSGKQGKKDMKKRKKKFFKRKEQLKAFGKKPTLTSTQNIDRKTFGFDENVGNDAAVPEALSNKTLADIEEGSGEDELLFVPPTIKNKGRTNTTSHTNLGGSRFRWLNELLYTTNGSEAFNAFQKDPSLFTIYHSGYQEQVSQWPVDPLDKIITLIQSSAKQKLTIADFGCGTARLEETLAKKHFVSSFDLIASKPSIIACDIAHVPLENESQDIVVFCLSLMGTNFVDYLQEAFRVLKPNGKLFVAEVVSRIESVGRFIRGLALLGFDKVSEDDTNKMFIIINFVKTKNRINVEKAKKLLYLKPCLYKKR